MPLQPIIILLMNIRHIGVIAAFSHHGAFWGDINVIGGFIIRTNICPNQISYDAYHGIIFIYVGVLPERPGASLGCHLPI